MTAPRRQPIAIVGTSCLLPQADDVARFWEHLMAGRDLIIESTGQIAKSMVRGGKGVADHTCTDWAGWREDSPTSMDGFAVPAAELEGLGRPFRWTVEAGRAALRSAGLWNEGAPEFRDRCGLVLGGYSWSMTDESMQLLRPMYAAALQAGLQSHPAFAGIDLSDADAPVPSPVNAMMSGMIAGVAARSLALGGPHYAIDAACASALYCLKLGALHLWRGQCDVMLAGGVSAYHPVFGLLGFSTLQALPDGTRSRPFDTQSDGLALAEGAACFVLKRLCDAERDGDTIHAIIRGIGLSNDGRGRHLLAPNTRGQMRAYERAYEEAGLPAGEVDYVECHATGTALGDKTELESLGALCKGRALPWLGSVKSNMGHLLAAAGLASALKVIGAMRTGIIPPTIGIREPLRSAEGFGGERIIRTETLWPETGRARRGAVNAFGFGGANAHLVLEEVGGRTPDIEHRTSNTEYKTSNIQHPTSNVQWTADVREPMAVIGMDGTFGGDDGIPALRKSALTGASTVRKQPVGRWRGLEALGAEAQPEGSYIESFAIDPLRYHLPPEVIERLNPAQILMLRIADGALKSSGLSSGGRVAVIVASAADPTSHRLQMRWELEGIVDRALAKTGEILAPADRAALLAVLRDSTHEVAQSADFPGYIGNLLASRISALWDLADPR